MHISLLQLYMQCKGLLSLTNSKDTGGEMSKNPSVHDVVQSAGRACAQQGAAIADTRSRHPHSVTKAGTLRLLEEAETQERLCKP